MLGIGIERDAFPRRIPMSSMAKMAIFVVLGSALTVGALVIASFLNTAAG